MKTLVLTTANGGHTAFSLSDQELDDLCFALSLSIADSESFLNSYADYMSIEDQMRNKRRIDRFHGLLEQFNRGQGYELF